LIGAPGLVDQVDDHFAVLHQIPFHCFPEIQDWLAAAVRVLEMLDPFGLTFLPEEFRDTLGQLLLMLTGFEIAGGVPLRVTGSHAKRLPKLWLKRAQAHVPAVFSLIDVVAGQPVIEKVISGRGNYTVGDEFSQSQAVPGEGAVGHRNIDELASAMLLTCKQ